MAYVLLVEDDRTERAFARAVLAGAGHEVTEAEDGARAILVLGEQSFDLVITDIQMPHVDGFGVIGAVYRLTERPPIIVISGAGEHELALARNAGAVAALSKPVDRRRLLDAVQSALEFAD